MTSLTAQVSALSRGGHDGRTAARAAARGYQAAARRRGGDGTGRQGHPLLGVPTRLREARRWPGGMAVAFLLAHFGSAASLCGKGQSLPPRLWLLCANSCRGVHPSSSAVSTPAFATSNAASTASWPSYHCLLVIVAFGPRPPHIELNATTRATCILPDACRI